MSDFTLDICGFCKGAYEEGSITDLTLKMEKITFTGFRDIFVVSAL